MFTEEQWALTVLTGHLWCDACKQPLERPRDGNLVAHCKPCYTKLRCDLVASKCLHAPVFDGRPGFKEPWWQMNLGQLRKRGIDF